LCNWPYPAELGYDLRLFKRPWPARQAKDLEKVLAAKGLSKLLAAGRKQPLHIILGVSFRGGRGVAFLK
jgi:hypothetical protein